MCCEKVNKEGVLDLSGEEHIIKRWRRKRKGGRGGKGRGNVWGGENRDK